MNWTHRVLKDSLGFAIVALQKANFNNKGLSIMAIREAMRRLDEADAKDAEIARLREALTILGGLQNVSVHEYGGWITILHGPLAKKLGSTQER